MPWTTAVRRHAFPNGLTLLVEQVPGAEVVAVVTHVKAGYFDEPDEWVGIAHVLEHMYFKGTARRRPGDIARETQLVGGYVNAGTIYDKTVYYTVLPSADGALSRAVDIQADALMHSALDVEELGRELEVIIQEAKRKLDSPGAVVVERLYALLFQRHRMRRWRIGTEENLRRLTAADVRRYYESRYTPDRVIVGIVGDLDLEEAHDLAAAHYADWDRPARTVAGSPAETGERRSSFQVMHGDVERPLAEIGWRTVDTLHPDAAALDVAAMVLGSGRGSRLYGALREPGIAASAHASHYTPTEVGVFQVGLEVEAARLDEAVDVALRVVTGLRREPPVTLEIERARSLLSTRWARGFETMDGRASMLCEAEALGGYDLADELFERALAVTEDDVRRVADQYLDPGVANATVYLPEGTATGLQDSWPPRGEASVRLEVPAPVVAPRRGAGEAGSEELPGGVLYQAYDSTDLLLRSKSGSGLVTLLIHFPGVTTEETASNAGISTLLSRSALRGAGGLSGRELGFAAERLGSSLGAAVGADGMGWGITVARERTTEAAELLRRVAFEAELEDGVVELERTLQISDARQERDDMFRYPLQRVLREAYPADAYGLPSTGDPEQLRRVEPAHVREWAGSLSARRAVVVAVGDFTLGELARATEPLVARRGEVQTGLANATPEWMPGRAAESRRKQQTALAMAFPSSPFGSPDRYPLRVTAALLSGLAGRLFESLRERRALAYTVATIPWLALRAGVVLTYIATSPEREEEAREAMLEELGRLVREPPTGDELDRARNYAAGTEQVRRQTGAAIASEILKAWVGAAMDDMVEVPNRLRAVTTDQVVDVAERVFRADVRAEYVVRGGEGEGRLGKVGEG